MVKCHVIWPPYPYKAGFCITDDTDAATYEQVSAVYNFLSSKNFLTTKTVWPFLPSEKCGIPPTPDSTLRGITLQNQKYLDYCKQLHRKGYEICLHGASAGNNRRESTIQAIDFLKEKIGHSDTFICHSKNADNIYWNEKITSLFPFKIFLKFISKNQCSGEITSSPYFWGDICYRSFNQIRLFRTRCLNTLKRNPSMPYFSPKRPFVNGWFSATKRSLIDCAKKSHIEKLIQENGLTILYQYLHRYANPNGGDLNPRFVESIEALSSNSLLKIDTVSNTLNRLRMIQGLFFIRNKNVLWIINSNHCNLDLLQIKVNKAVQLHSSQCQIKFENNTAIIDTIPSQSMIKIECSSPIVIRGNRSFLVGSKRTLLKKLAYSTLYVNLNLTPQKFADGVLIGSESFYLDTKISGTGLPLLSKLPLIEEISLIMGQFWIVAREILFKGRSLNSSKYLDDSKEIILENHDHW